MKISVSQFMRFCESPKHYKWLIDHGSEQTLAMKEGEAFHMAIFEPERFKKKVKSFESLKSSNEYKILSTVDDLKSFLSSIDVSENYKSYKKADLIELCKIYKTDEMQNIFFENELEDKFLILPESSLNRILYMRDSVFNTEFWKLNGDLGENEVLLEGKILGIDVRGRIDKFFKKNETIYFCDAKKTTSVKKRLFEAEIKRQNIHVQLFMYDELIKQNFEGFRQPVLLPCESYPPYICQPFIPDDIFIDSTREFALYQLKKFKKCFKENKWPGYSERIAEMCSLPSYAFSDFEYEHIEDDTDE